MKQNIDPVFGHYQFNVTYAHCVGGSKPIRHKIFLDEPGETGRENEYVWYKAIHLAKERASYNTVFVAIELVDYYE